MSSHYPRAAVAAVPPAYVEASAWPEWNASRLVGQARKLELVFAFGARLISTVQPQNFDYHFSTIFGISGKNEKIL